MATTISLNINGNSGGGGNTNPPNPPVPPNTPPSPPNPPIPPSSGGGGGNAPMPWSTPNSQQLVADIRREMASRGVMLVPGTSNYTQLINQLRTQQANNLNTGISEYFGAVRTDIINRYYDKQDEFTQRINNERQQALQGITDQDDIDAINLKYDRKLRAEERRLKNLFDPEFQQADTEEAAARSEAEKELTKAINELVDETRRGNKNAYITELRDRYKTVIYNRDNAESKEDVRRYSKEAQKIQEEISSAMGGGSRRSGGIFGPVTPVMSFGTEWANRALQLYNLPYQQQIGHIQSLNQFAQGDPFGAMLNENQLKRTQYDTYGSIIGTAIGAIAGAALAPFTGGMSLLAGTAIGGAIGGGVGNAVAGWLGSTETKQGDVLANLGRSYQQLESRIKTYNDLTMISRAPGQDIENQRDWLINTFGQGWTNGQTGLTNRDLGLDAASFAQMLSGRIRARGIWDEREEDNYNRAFMSEGLERVFNLNPNSLAQLSGFDRYGNDANQAATNLFTTLSRQGTIGMTGGHYLRSNEFLGYMQQAMAAQKGWMNPNANFAARQVATLQSMFGNNLDERAMSELGQINNAVTNPQEGMASVITNDVIQQLFPETRGNLLAIREKQYSNDPKVREEIQRAMFSRLTDMYGGMNTNSGYLAFSQYTGIQDPNRLRAWVDRMQKGYVNVEEGDQAEAVKQLGTGYTPKLSQEIMKGQDEAITQINSNSKRMADVSQMILDVLKTQMKDIAIELSKIELKTQ